MPAKLRHGFARPIVNDNRDLGRNGTFLAIRQLEQDVDGFWEFCAQTAGRLHAQFPQWGGVRPEFVGAKLIRILDHRSIVLVDPMGAMARLQLARALAVLGDVVKAKSAYKDLLTLWDHADPKIPIVEQARAEYARLP